MAVRPVRLRGHPLRRARVKKKAAQTPRPVVLLSLRVLDRQPLLKTSSVLGLVVGLLDTVTRPLVGLKVTHKTKGAAMSTTAPGKCVPER